MIRASTWAQAIRLAEAAQGSRNSVFILKLFFDDDAKCIVDDRSLQIYVTLEALADRQARSWLDSWVFAAGKRQSIYLIDSFRPYNDANWGISFACERILPFRENDFSS